MISIVISTINRGCRYWAVLSLLAVGLIGTHSYPGELKWSYQASNRSAAEQLSENAIGQAEQIASLMPPQMPAKKPVR